MRSPLAPTLLALFAFAIAPAARAQSGVLLPGDGVLLPGDKEQPDPAVLSLEEMKVSIAVNNGEARVSIVQIFANHTATVKEGTYVFALPSGTTVSDFAVWDGPVRIPAVILERERAEAVYDRARMQAIDPGLLETGENEGSDGEVNPRSPNTFTVKVVPIPAYGTKRLELEYHQRLPVDRLMQGFVLPLGPSDAGRQTAAHLAIHFQVQSGPAITDATLRSAAYPMQLAHPDAHTLKGDWQGDNVALSEDLNIGWQLDPADADTLNVITFRNPEPIATSPADRTPAPPGAEQATLRATEPGFFLAQTLLAMPPAHSGPASPSAPPRDLVLLFDNSLSMQWDKLERSFAALQAALHGLAPADHFSLLLFNQEVTAYAPQPVAATPENIEAALRFVRASRLRGGTDLGKALAAGLAQATLPNASLLLLTDGNSDRGATVLTREIAAAYAREWNSSATHPRTTVFAVGDDANLPLLRQLATHDGVLEHVLSTEPIDAKLSAFLAHSISAPVAGLHLAIAPSAAIHTIYPLDDAVYPGSVASWVGDYLSPQANVTFTAEAQRVDAPLHAAATVDLPPQALAHPELPWLWAQARVDALLDEIARNGETREAIEEIVRLSRRYKFVTPYTSFLAAPRSLLRPRVIRPGDPVLRVHTDPAIVSVIALFPFGLTQPLRHLASEDKRTGPDSDRLWETRFLAPPDMGDGVYTVRLILRDAAGHTYAEAKTFVIASTAPTVRLHLDRVRYHRGDMMQLRAQASATTRTLTAQMEGALPVPLRWNNAAAANTGEMRVPQSLAPGSYTVSVTAEDIAHNLGTQEVRIDVLP